MVSGISPSGHPIFLLFDHWRVLIADVPRAFSPAPSRHPEESGQHEGVAKRTAPEDDDLHRAHCIWEWQHRCAMQIIAKVCNYCTVYYIIKKV